MDTVGRVFAFPFKLLWGLAIALTNVVGRLLAVILGLTLMIVGIVLSLTIIGAVIGIPLFIVGVGLVIKGLFP